MADYPSLCIEEGSRATPQTGLRLDRASNGDARAQSFYAGDKQDFDIIHQPLNASEKAGLDNFYAAHRLSTFTFDWLDGQTYTVIFRPEGIVFTPLQGGYWRADVALAEV